MNSDVAHTRHNAPNTTSLLYCTPPHQTSNGRNVHYTHQARKSLCLLAGSPCHPPHATPATRPLRASIAARNVLLPPHQARTHRAAQRARPCRSSAPERLAPRAARTRRAQTRPAARRDLGRSSRPTRSRQIMGGSRADGRARHGGHYRPGWRRSKLPSVLAVLAARCSLAAPPWLGLG